MPLKLILTGLLSLVAGILFGRYLPHEMATDPPAGYNQQGGTSAGLESPNTRQTARSTQRSRRKADVSRSDSIPSDRQEPGKLVTVPVSLLERLASRTSKPSLDQELFSSDGVVEKALQITDREKAQIQQAWRQVRSDVRKLETGAASFKDLPDGSVQISIPDLSESMQELGSSFSAATKDVLGDNRAEAFLAIKQVDNAFRAQQGKQTCTVKMEAVGNGQWRYTIRRGRGGVPSAQWITRSIPASLRHLTDKAGIQPKLQAPPEEPED